MLVGRERHAVAVLGAIDRVGHVADAEQIGALEQRDAVGLRESRSPRSTLSAIGRSAGSLISARVESNRQWARRHSSNRLMASETLWPPNPKLLLNTARTARFTAVFGV